MRDGDAYLRGAIAPELVTGDRGTLSGTGGPKDVINAHPADCTENGVYYCRHVTFSYVYTEFEFELRRAVHLMLRPQVGQLTTDTMPGSDGSRCQGRDITGCELLTGFGGRARLRLGDELGTNLVIGERAWHDMPFDRSSAGGAEVDHFASPAEPHVVRIEPSLADRLDAQDRARLSDLDNELAVDVIGHDFGNRYDLADRFVRGEIVYTHRVLRTIHEIGFGFGAIQGRTPDAMEDASVSHGLRYGFGQLRVRIDPSVFLDARVGMGVSHDGFGGQTRAQLTFGKPWRSCLQVGAEYIGDLGPSGWVRLQWDTAPPLLMGASIVRTDLPGAMTSAIGLYVAYDVAYRVTERVTVRGQLSFGPRDGVAHLGGGLGTAVAF